MSATTIFTLTIIFLFVFTANAATITVNTLTDENNTNNAACSLREAINNANGNNTTNGLGCVAGSGTDDIVISVSGTINLSGVLPDISSSINITGNGANLLTVRRDTGGNYRIFNITSGTVAISGLTVSNGALVGSGSSTLFGGGIQNAGTLTLTNVAIRNNQIVGGSGGGLTNNLRGAGIYSTGTLNFDRVTVSGNRFESGGGGAANLTCFGAGIFSSGAVTITNGTISGNTTSGGSNGTQNFQGGGIYHTNSLTLTNVTITRNSVNSSGSNGTNNVKGGGIFRSAGTTAIKNTIIAGNSSNFGDQDLSGAFTSSGNNLIGRGNGSTGFINGTNGDLVGTDAAPINAQLGLLANNGGQTQTHAFNCAATSPAQNAGTSTGAPITDQREQARNGAVDIGSFELQTSGECNAPTITPNAAISRTRGNAAILANIATVSDTQNPAGDLYVTATTVPSGIIITNFTNTNGTITADIAATIDAAAGTNIVVFTVEDGSALTATANFTVNVLNPPNRTYNVNDLGDATDSNIGDGICQTAGAVCTLRAALDESFVYPVNTINFTVSGTVNLSGALPNVKGDVIFNGNAAGNTIRRDSGGEYRVFNLLSNAVVTMSNFNIQNGGGYFANTTFEGAGIRNAGNLTLDKVTVSGNIVVTEPNFGAITNVFQGMGIFNTGTLAMTNCTVSGNAMNGTFGGSSNNTLRGAGIYNSGSLTTLNVTLVNNSIGNNGTGTREGGGIFNSGAASLKNTIVAGNISSVTDGNDVFGTFISNSNNLIGRNNGSTGFINAVNGDVVGTNASVINANLGTLGNYGGGTQTHSVFCTSPARDSGNNAGAPTTDQRGIARPFNLISDIGAFEFASTCTNPNLTAGGTFNRTRNAGGAISTIATVSDNEDAAGTLPVVVQTSPTGIVVNSITNTSGTITANISALGSANLGANVVNLSVTDSSGLTTTASFTVNVTAAPPLSLTINDLGDADDFANGDGICETATGNGICTLRAAIQEANAFGGSLTTINFSLSGTINLGSVLPPIAVDANFNGNAAGNVIRRNSGGDYRILEIASSKTAALSNLAITNGRLQGTSNTNTVDDLAGAGILNNGTLTLNGVLVNGNNINCGDGLDSTNILRGAGIFNGGTLTLINSTVSGNSITGEATFPVSHTFRGGGIYSAGTILLTNSTIASNSVNRADDFFGPATNEGGGLWLSGTVNVKNTIIAANSFTGSNFNPSAGIDAFGTVTSGGNNLIGNTANNSGWIASDIQNQNARLNPLANNGGATSTHSFGCLPTSPALNAGNSDVTGAPLNLINDQRGAGFPRQIGAAVDIGAYEEQIGFCSPPTITPEPTLTRTRGASGTVSNIAVVSDANDAAASLVVTAFSVPAGITLTSITNTNGTISANVAAGQNAISGANTIVLRVTDLSGLTTDANLIVNVIVPTAVSLIVNDLGDGADATAGNGVCETVLNNGICTLRAAIQELNAANGGNDVINFSVSGIVQLTSALPNITSSITINGNAAGTTIRRNTGGNYRIFFLPSGGELSLNNLTVTNGLLPNGTGNATTTNLGGGIRNDNGRLTLTNVTVSGNSLGTPGSGGSANNTFRGANIYSTGILSVTNSTISGGSIGTGGGNSINTLQGGGIYVAGSATLTNVTVTANSGGANGSGTRNNVSGGGIFAASGATITLQNTIVAGNTSTNDLDVSGAFTSGGNNLIGRNNGSTGFTNGTNGDLVGTNASPLLARLGALASNGGTMQTHLLLCNSPAINAGNNSGAPATDQRGISRPQNSIVDIGAVEVQTADCTYVWTGATDTDWNNAANWSGGIVPSGNEIVVIPTSGVTNQPTFSGTISLNNLTIETSRTLTLSGAMSINGNLNLAGGVIQTGANTLSLGANATLTRTSGYVIGNLRKQFSGASNSAFTYAVGTANGYSPVNTNVSGTGDLTISATQTVHPNLQPAQSLKRFWSLSGNGITTDLTFNYLDPTDINGTEANYGLYKINGMTNTPITPFVLNTAANTMSVAGISSFSDWAIGALPPTSASVSVGGRVLNSQGNAVSKALVQLTDANGQTRYAVTNPFGFYHFVDVSVGESYIFTVTSKQYEFVPQIIQVSEATENLNFIAVP